MVLDSVSYSNALPPWFDVPTIDYSARERTIEKRIGAYLAGERPEPPFEVSVPRKAGAPRVWLLPSVNDQIVLQTCISALAERMFAAVDSSRVFSYPPPANPSRLELADSQVGAWTRFQEETRNRLARSPFMLQVDLAQAFASIGRERFLRFAQELAPGSMEVELLASLAAAWGRDDRGLPLMNDSLFFAGNSYLKVVDEIMLRHSADFIRFVDDYRVFGTSSAGLEAILARVTTELRQLGFTINSTKLRLGSSEEYLEAISKVRYESTVGDPGSPYVSTAVFGDVVPPDVLTGAVSQVMTNPELYLNEGFGRLALGAIRRMRADSVMAARMHYEKSPRDSFRELLTKKSSVVRDMIGHLNAFRRSPEAAWQSVWILYVADDLELDRMEDQALARELRSVVAEIRSESTEAIVRLWASRLWLSGSQCELSLAKIEAAHAASYPESGRICYGGR
ncbi:MAG TPA: RNA-directed DNA polymerase [Thermoanaerobaculia bacterium]|nr:RNA-directed DNA polymerase [Thermoanaerobaculia bacterium]